MKVVEAPPLAIGPDHVRVPVTPGTHRPVRVVAERSKARVAERDCVSDAYGGHALEGDHAFVIHFPRARVAVWDDELVDDDERSVGTVGAGRREVETEHAVRDEPARRGHLGNGANHPFVEIDDGLDVVRDSRPNTFSRDGQGTQRGG